jgi:molybdopterin-guanine dinucleotide biosynthesis protein A
MTAFSPADVTGLVLAGGRGSRMGGVDKGLQKFNRVPLGACAASRLAQQVGRVVINANRNLPTYETFGFPVWPDDEPADYAGPLAGFLTGLTHCETEYLLTVPCDTPLFPHDLARRLADAMVDADADITMAMAAGHSESDEGTPKLRPQPVFCLLRARPHINSRTDRTDAPADLRDSLQRFMQRDGRKVGAWTAQHRTVLVPFDRPGDAPDAFLNANTLDELHAMQAR